MKRSSQDRFTLGVVSGLLLQVACTGVIGESTLGSDDQTAGAMTGGTGPGATPVGGPGIASPDCTAAPKLVEPRLHRLTRAEYTVSVAALLGTNVPGSSALRPDGRYLDRYENEVGYLGAGVDSDLVTALASIASEGADLVLSDSAARSRLLGCSAQNEDCLTPSAFIESFGRLAYRRPLTDAEKTSLNELAAEGANDPDDPNAEYRLALLAILQSPHFIYRPELGQPDPRTPGRRQLDGYELAAKLSYFLTGSPPDSDLLDAAARGELADAASVAEKARLLLSSPLAERGAQRFFEQWLKLQELDDAFLPGQAAGVNWSPTLIGTLRESAMSLLGDFGGRPGNFLRVLAADYAYTSGDAATLYGLKPQDGRIDLASSARGGLLSEPGILALNSTTTEFAQPITRGKYVLETFLCRGVPSPPTFDRNSIPGLEGSPQDLDVTQLSARERLAYVEMQGSAATGLPCGSCHSLLTPIGFGFEQLDAAGRFAETDSAGRPLSGAGDLSVAGITPGAFQGVRELGEKLSHSQDVADCVAKQMFIYGSATRDAASDECGARELAEAFTASGHDFQTLLLDTVQNERFRYVKGMP